MEIASTAINAAVVSAVGVILAWLGRGRFHVVEKQIEALNGRVDRLQASFDAMRIQFQGSLDSMRAESQGSLDSMRSDLTQVALAVGAHPRAENA